MASLLLKMATLAALVPSGFACFQGIESIGSVSPMGDIVRAVGSDLIINCSLLASYAGPATADNIRWRKDGQDVPLDLITALDDRSAQLKITNASAEDSGYYSCYVNLAQPATVCNNAVSVGYVPYGDVNISCVALNWQNMTCRWSPPYNPVRTRWSFFNRISKYRQECPEYLDKHRLGCFFGDQTSPTYRQPAESYFFVLEGRNPLGYSRTDYRFAHYELIIPNPPENLISREVDSRRVYVRWDPPKGMALFPPMLFYRIQYKSLWDQSWKIRDVGLNITNITLSGLIPNTNYTIQVECRSGASVESPWSALSVVWKKTPPDYPGAAPLVTSSGFQQKKTITHRQVSLHWQSIPRIMENGDSVSYMIDAVEDGLQRNVTVTELTQTSALVTGLELEKSYLLRIRAKNEKGVSKYISEISIGLASEVPPIPDYVSAIAFYNGLYEVSWRPSELVNAESIQNYTVFWCDVPFFRPHHPCYNGSIGWRNVGHDQNALNLTLSSLNNYQFAVASNDNKSSSGMTWTTCIVPIDGVVGKLKSVSLVNVRAEEIDLSWSLSCSERLGTMTGFYIYYCIFDMEENRCLGNDTFQEFVPNPHADRYTVSSLKPFTTYKLTVSAVTRAGEGEQSDPIFNKTLEGAPKDSCILGLSEVTNTSMVVVVEKPHIPNGIIRKFVFSVNGRRWDAIVDKGRREFLIDQLVSYTNYTVQVVACTVGEMCSPLSEALQITTKIGIPGPPDILDVKLQNSSHLRVEWEDPFHPNGPILIWTVALTWLNVETGEPTLLENSFAEDGGRVHFFLLPMPCTDDELMTPSPEYNVSVRAQTVMLDGIPSKPFTINPCIGRGSEAIPIWVLALIVVGSVSLILVVCVLLRGLRRLKIKVREMQNIKVQLPKGLDSPNITSLSSYNYKASGGGSLEPSRGSHVTQPLCKRLDSSGSRHGDAVDPRFSTSSIDELLYPVKSPRPDKVGRNLSGDSSGCSTGHDSISSSFTIRTHLSVDSGADVDTPPLPSPDSVFTEPNWKLGSTLQNSLRHRSSSLPKVDEGSSPATSEDIAPNYAKFARYLPTEQIAAKPRLSCLASQDSDSDYLEPILSPTSTSAHVSVNAGPLSKTAPNSLIELRKTPPPKVPPRAKPLQTSGTMAVSYSSPGLNQEGSRSFSCSTLEPLGYAKIGLSDAAITSKCLQQVEDFKNNSALALSEGNRVSNPMYKIVPIIPSSKSEPRILPTPLSFRTQKAPIKPLEFSNQGSNMPKTVVDCSGKSSRDAPPSSNPCVSSSNGEEKISSLPPSGYVTLDSIRGEVARENAGNPKTSNPTSGSMVRERPYDLSSAKDFHLECPNSATPYSAVSTRSDEKASIDPSNPHKLSNVAQNTNSDYWKLTDLTTSSKARNDATDLPCVASSPSQSKLKTSPMNHRKYFKGPKTYV